MAKKIGEMMGVGKKLFIIFFLLLFTLGVDAKVLLEQDVDPNSYAIQIAALKEQSNVDKLVEALDDYSVYLKQKGNLQAVQIVNLPTRKYTNNLLKIIKRSFPMAFLVKRGVKDKEEIVKKPEKVIKEIEPPVKPEEPEIKPQKISKESYKIAVGAFGKIENVEKLQDRFIEKGEKVFVEQKGTLYKLYIVSEGSMELAQKKLAKIKKTFPTAYLIKMKQDEVTKVPEIIAAPEEKKIDKEVSEADFQSKFRVVVKQSDSLDEINRIKAIYANEKTHIEKINNEYYLYIIDLISYSEASNKLQFIQKDFPLAHLEGYIEDEVQESVMEKEIIVEPDRVIVDEKDIVEAEEVKEELKREIIEPPEEEMIETVIPFEEPIDVESKDIEKQIENMKIDLELNKNTILNTYKKYYDFEKAYK